jgi:hypothetical protein
MLEAAEHEENTFVTLTYDDEHLPEGSNLDVGHARNFIRRLNRRYETPRRHYIVGEYGDRSQRPHYHAALFGVANCVRGRTHTGRRNGCCDQCVKIGDLWPYGQVYLGSLTRESASYVVGYVTKKLTAPDDPRLEGRTPEFARMSRNPGIGAGAAWEIASTVLTHNLRYVPNTLRINGREIPLGAYLKGKVREYTGLQYAPPKENQELQKMSEAIYSDDAPFKAERFREALIQANWDRAQYQESRERRQVQRKTL